MRSLLPLVAMLVACLPLRAEVVTVVYSGTIDRIDAPLAAGPFAIGETISGSYSYENDPLLNPDTNPGTVGQYLLDGASPVTIGGVPYATSPGTQLTIFNDVDGWDMGVGIAAPPIGAYNTIGFSVSLRDLDSTVFADDSLPAAPPPLAEFETAELSVIYFNGSSIAEVVAPVTLHELQSEPLTFAFAGPLISEDDAGNATYSNVDVDGPMSGELTIGATSGGSTYDAASSTWFFPGAPFFGTLLGDGDETSTEGSARPLEVRFLDDVVSDVDTIDLINSLLGTSLPPGTPYDLAEIETDVTSGNRRIEFGLSFISLDLGLIVDDGYRPFPTLDEVDLALYFVVEELDDVEIFNALGRVDSFGAPSTPGEATRLLADGIAVGQIALSYTAGCSATDHTLVWGPLDQVASYAYTGQLCAVGADGSTSLDPGSGDAFFLIVAADGTIEGSYGQASTGAERPEDLTDPVCPLTQDLSNSCN